MFEVISFLDDLLSPWAPELLRIVIWGCLSAAFSMGLYAKLSPQKKLLLLKEEQKASRKQLMSYDGEWDGLSTLIKRDLSLSLKQMGLIFLPFVLSVAPVVVLMTYLLDIYTSTYTSFGPEWMRGFEFWYILSLLVVSLYLKFKFHIA